MREKGREDSSSSSTSNGSGVMRLKKEVGLLEGVAIIMGLIFGSGEKGVLAVAEYFFGRKLSSNLQRKPIFLQGFLYHQREFSEMPKVLV